MCSVNVYKKWVNLEKAVERERTVGDICIPYGSPAKRERILGSKFTGRC
jgi:hypothetical protein